jgi:hypothetical protein
VQRSSRKIDSAGNLAVKLLRTYTMQAEALAKLERGGWRPSMSLF